MSFGLLATNAEDGPTCLLTKGFKPVRKARQVPFACHLISLLLDGLPQPCTLAVKVPEHCQPLRPRQSTVSLFLLPFYSQGICSACHTGKNHLCSLCLAKICALPRSEV